MNRIACLGLLTLAACKPLPPRGHVPVDVAAALPRVVLQLDDASPNIYLEAAVAAGSVHDPIGSEGLASLTAHAMLAGGAGDRDADAVREALYVTGNAPELVVGHETVSVRLRCHRDQADLCVDLFADMLVAPRFDADAVAQVREEATYAITDGLRSDEEHLAYQALDAWLFEAHPYGHPVEGRAGVLGTLDADDVRAFHAGHYVRSATVIGVAGAASHAQVHRLMGRMEALSPAMAPEVALFKPLAVQGRSLRFVETGTDVVGFRFGFPTTVSRAHPDYPALLLAFTALGAHRQSFGTLFRELRGKRGLNYGTYAYLEPFQERGNAALPEQGVQRRQSFMHLWIRPTSAENAPFALKLAIAEWEDFVAEGIDADTFEDVQAYLLGAVPLLAQSPGRRLAYAVEAEATGMPDPLVTWPAALAALTLDEVRAAVQRHVQADDLRIVGVGGGGQAVVDALLGAGPTPITYADGLEPEAEQVQRDAEVAAKRLGLTADRVVVREVEGLFR